MYYNRISIAPIYATNCRVCDTFRTLHASTHGVHAFMACLQARIMHTHSIEAVVYGHGSEHEQAHLSIATIPFIAIPMSYSSKHAIMLYVMLCLSPYACVNVIFQYKQMSALLDFTCTIVFCRCFHCQWSDHKIFNILRSYCT